MAMQMLIHSPLLLKLSFLLQLLNWLLILIYWKNLVL